MHNGGPESGNDLRVLVVLDGDTIVVTMPGTRYSITYRKLHDTPLLVASDERDDPDSQISKAYVSGSSMDSS